LRTFAMLHILLGHRLGWTRPVPTINAIQFQVDGDWMKTFVGAFLGIHPIAVDTFFVMGGMLLTRSMLIQIEKEKLNIPKLYLHRYLRTTPVLAFLILLLMSIMKYFGDGPFWNWTLTLALKDSCQKYWWSALLHIQNYYNPLEVVSISIKQSLLI
jgi:peptidoglycan/LPS O-acetylase OafA/YrhL